MLEGTHVSSSPPVPLMGFIGPSGKDGLLRIYRDLTFRSYYDVPSDALQAVDSYADDPEAPSSFFIAADAPITVVEAETECAEAGFLSGSISRGRLGAPAAEATSPGQAHDAICKDTANPTYCEPMCITLYTGYPTWCPPTGTQLGAANDLPGAGRNNPVIAGGNCITLWTAYPSWCPPTTTTATAVGAADAQACITLWTAYPSWCPATCNNTGVPTACG